MDNEMLKKSRLPSTIKDAMEQMTESSLGHGSRHGSVDLGVSLKGSITDETLITSTSTDSETYL